MDYVGIAGTPLQLDLYFVQAGEAPPPRRRQLGGLQGTLLRALLEAQMTPEQAAAVEAALGKPLDEVFDAIWTGARGEAVGQVQQAVREKMPEAYNISVDFPAKGSLRAGTGDLSEGLTEQMPPNTQGTQLDLSYQLPGVTVKWDTSTNSIFGGYLDPSYTLTFDAEIALYLGVPNDARTPIVGLAQFVTSNQHASGNVFAIVKAIGDAIDNLLHEGPLFPSGESGSSTDLPLDSLAGLSAQLKTISDAFTQAASFGFTQVGVFVDTDPPQGDGNTVTFALTHPFEPGPVVTQVGGDDTGLFVPFARLAVVGTQARPGEHLGVTGTEFPLPTASALTITWTDTALGVAVQSEIEWGFATLGGGPPSQVNSAKIDRTNAYDGRNRFTTQGALAAESGYAFRVRDYSLQDQIATDWSAWTVIQTGDWDHVDLVLEDGHDTHVGTAEVIAGGELRGDIRIPDDEPPGSYRLWAYLGLRRLVSTEGPVQVLPPDQPPPPQITAYNGITHAALGPNGQVSNVNPIEVRGINFRYGTVSLYIDNASGAPLGDFAVNQDGTFAATVHVPHHLQGRHPIAAIEDGLAAYTDPINFSNPPA